MTAGPTEDERDGVGRMAQRPLRGLIADQYRSLAEAGAASPVEVLSRLGVPLVPTLLPEPEAPRSDSTVVPAHVENTVSLSELPTGGVLPGFETDEGETWPGRTEPSSGPPPGFETEGRSRLGRYRVGQELGRGGMGRVVEAIDPDLSRLVALKVLMGQVTPLRLSRFLAEAQLTSQLDHPNVVPVHELGLTAEGDLFFTMKKVRGRSLAQVLGELSAGEVRAAARWSQHRLLTAFEQITQAVGYAHSRGVLHRDLKPSNIMLGDFGEVLVMDWGLAQLIGQEGGPGAIRPPTEGDSRSTTRIVGTPGYMSPEQARDDQLDARSDVWSLGAVLYAILTWSAPYLEETLADQLVASQRPPEPPRQRAPHSRIPEELEDICLKAMAPDRAQRYATALELGEAVEAFLEGSLRRERAARRLEEAERAFDSYRALQQRERQLIARERVEALEVEAWRPLDDPRKAALWALREELELLGPEVERGFASVLAHAEGALSPDAGNLAARAFLARVYWHRLESAEQQGDRREQVYWRDRVLEYDDGRMAARLAGYGRVSLRTEPAGARVLCQRVVQRGLVWGLEEATSLGRTPLVERALPAGSYLLTIEAEDRPPLRYPVLLRRGALWDSGPEPVRVLTAEELGDDWIHIPAGPFQVGGDDQTHQQLPAGRPWLPGFLIGRYPVTSAAYARFLAWLWERRPDEAIARAPRRLPSARSPTQDPASLLFWEPPAAGAPWVLPERDRDGDPWDPQWPVCGVSWDDARAYAAWLAEQTGQPIRLVRELEFAKAGRGVDGRCFPWGNAFDASLCKMNQSRPGRPVPEPVGSFPHDCSVYGVRDLAGSIREWSADEDFDGDPRRRPVRGAAWSATGRLARIANRFGFEPHAVHSYLGFRIARALPGS